MEKEVSIEVWRPIAGYEGIYDVSSWGRVRGLEREVLLGRHARTVPAAILAQKQMKNGYRQVSLSRDNRQKYKLIHRLVAEAFCERPEGCNVVDHKDDNRANNRADNLRWTTHKGNTRYAIEKGRIKARSVRSSGGRYYAIMQMAADDGFVPQDIWRCCQGKSRTHRGERWEYADGMGDGIHG